MSDQDGQDKPLFLVVTIKPRLDRLEEAEAQLQSMRQNTLKEPGSCSCTWSSPRTTRTRGRCSRCSALAPRGTSTCASPTTPRATRFSKGFCVSLPTSACSTRNSKPPSERPRFCSDDLQPMTESG